MPLTQETAICHTRSQAPHRERAVAPGIGQRGPKGRIGVVEAGGGICSACMTNHAFARCGIACTMYMRDISYYSARHLKLDPSFSEANLFIHAVEQEADPFWHRFCLVPACCGDDATYMCGCVQWCLCYDAWFCAHTYVGLGQV